MATQTRTRRSLPTRALGVVGGMVALVLVSQLIAAVTPTSDPGPAGEPIAIDPLRPAVADLDPVAGPAFGEDGLSVTPDSTSDLERIKANIDFWSVRAAKNPGDFISSNRWGIAEIDLARATGDIGAYLRAQAAFDVTLQRDPTNAAALGYQGSVLVSLHRFVEAADLARGVMARRPNDPVALATLGDASLEIGDIETASDMYARAHALTPSAATLVRLSHVAFIGGDTEAARRFAHSAVAASRAEGATGERAAFYHYQFADVLISTGDLEAAAKAYKAALRADAHSFLARSGLARVAAVRGDVGQAIDQLSLAIDIVPQPQFLARRGDLYALRRTAGDPERAAADYATVDAIATLAGETGSVYDRTLVLYLADHGLEPDRALRLSEAELTERKDVYGYDAAAWALLAAGRAVDAEAAMAKALAFGTRDAKLLYHAGLISAALGHDDRARGLLEDSLQLDASFDPLQVLRARQELARLP